VWASFCTAPDAAPDEDSGALTELLSADGRTFPLVVCEGDEKLY